MPYLSWCAFCCWQAILEISVWFSTGVLLLAVLRAWELCLFHLWLDSIAHYRRVFTRKCKHLRTFILRRGLRRGLNAQWDESVRKGQLRLTVCTQLKSLFKGKTTAGGNASCTQQKGCYVEIFQIRANQYWGRHNIWNILFFLRGFGPSGLSNLNLWGPTLANCRIQEEW